MKRSLSCLILLLASTTVYAEPNMALMASSCAGCHGTDGHSKGDMPKLAGLAPEYFIEQMQDFISGERESSVMRHHAGAYSETEIRLLAKYFSEQ
ncbi:MULTISPECIES: c-type cytochrome [unclassified Methylophaga]|jgi:cytochrome c553|uniref:c-type cytochrome n=1 Tax=unclassified Methylophaga TaxID=2629249 RepID=UPI000C91AA39|nr:MULTISPECIES: c-type cytochrome [unclassified Methylophaga]MAK66430.1 cytochrome C [Methylophaga sp.]MAY17124.1 cytochrome C [Methylophaga sp.]MBN46087.1 cytochrome C [Methylophaga sp.]HAO24217.1 cytochrome C [Methylophaga sp.]HCD05319.1 cytochrome C [Methylophaga sp.]|tara:strand:+ start:4131 stop:4415 length:285 start_codon:yes stop_codon:yes gene_type:complete